MSDKIDLSKEDFSFVCPMKTEDMTTIEGGYFCSGCEQKVHDVSTMTQNEYKTLLEKTENICVSFKKVATVSLALSLAACASPQEQKQMLLGKVVAPKSTCNIDTNKTTDKSPEIPKEADKNGS